MEKKEKKRSAVAAVPFPKADDDGYSGYINAIYDAADNARTSQLEAAYNKAAADLAQVQAKTNAAYSDGMRQLSGQGQQNAAAFREIANARGLNTGASGQAAMMLQNQMQNDVSQMEQARAQSAAELAMEKQLLDQNFEAQRRQLMAQNQYNRNMALYDEAVRMDGVRQQQEQFETQMNQQRLQMAIAQRRAELEAAAKAAKVGGGDYAETPSEPSMEDEILYERVKQMLTDAGVETTPFSPESYYKIKTMPYDSYYDYISKYYNNRVGALGGA